MSGDPQGYPTWVYRCRRGPNGRYEEDGIVIHSPAEWDRARRDGFVYGGPHVAKDALEACERAVADAAADAAGAAQKMSKKAKAEYARREAATDQHVTE